MNLTLIGITGIICLLFFLMVFGMPVGFAMGIVGFAGVCFVTSPTAALGMIGTEFWNTFSAYSLTMIPLFVFMGEICFFSGLNGRLFRATHVLTGHIRGGLAVATVIACAGFAAICGSNTATAATMTTVSLPEMKKYRYDNALSVGSIACGSTLGVVIPPSVVLILVGLSTGESITKLFYGGVFAGLVLAVFFMVTILVLCRMNPSWSPLGERRYTLAEKWRSLSGVIEAFVLFSVVMGGLYIGVFTPTEAGAVGSFIACIIALMGRRLSWQRFTSSIVETLEITGMVFVIITGAVIFSRFLTLTRIPYDMAGWVAALPVPPIMVIAVIFIIYTIGGALMDALALLMITIPIFFPVAMELGYDPIWFGVMITVITTLGAVTPPVGATMYVVAGMARDVPMTTVFRGIAYFLPAYVLCIVLLMAVPEIITFLPRMIR